MIAVYKQTNSPSCLVWSEGWAVLHSSSKYNSAGLVMFTECQTAGFQRPLSTQSCHKAQAD